MNNTIIFTSIFVYFFESLLFWFYCQTAFKSKYSKVFNYAIIFAAMAVCCVTQILFTSLNSTVVTVINTVTNIACFAAVIYFLYGQKLLNAIVHAVVYFALVAAGEYIVIPFMSTIFGGTLTKLYENNAFYFFMAVSSKFAHLVLTLLALKIYLTFFVKGNTGVKNKEKIKGLLFAFLIPFSCLIMFLVTELLYAEFSIGTKEAIYLTINALLLIVVTFAAFYLHNNTVNQAKKISRFTIEQKQREFDAQYFALVKKSNEEMQVLSHDFKNHLVQIADADNMDEVKAYVNKLYPTIQQFHSVNVSDNKTLNTIISKYNSLCAVKGIDFKYEISASLSFLENNDLTAILGNLLDNALESAEKCAEKRIALSIYSKNEKTTVWRIKNTCESAPVVKKGKLQTTKTDDAPHGLGLKSVESTVKKYGGFYEWEYDSENKEFETLISFYR